MNRWILTRGFEMFLDLLKRKVDFNVLARNICGPMRAKGYFSGPLEVKRGILWRGLEILLDLWEQKEILF